jgi:hypothetical protein
VQGRAADEVVATSVEHRKALRNEGTIAEPIHFSLADDTVAISNLDNIGISLGPDHLSSLASWASIKNSALGGINEGVSVDLKEKVIEKVEKETIEEEELDKLLLENICGEIMEEVMDLMSDFDVILPRGQNKKKDRKGKRVKKL